MTPYDFRFGLYVCGPTYSPRQPVDWGRLSAAAAAAAPPFDPPARPVGDLIGELEHDWTQAAAAVAREAAEKAERNAAQAAARGPDRLNRLTLEFIARGAEYPGRHRSLYSAALNLAEFGCPPRLAFALLMPAALDCGLAPKDAGRQIECGLRGEPQTPASPPAEGG